MKIAMMTYSLKPRGGVVHALSLAEAIQRRSYHIELFALRRVDQAQQYPGFFRETTVPFHIYDFKWHDNIKERLEAMVSAYVKNLPMDFDIYHAQDCVCDTALQRLRAIGKLKAPIIRTVHHVEGFADEYLDRCERDAIGGDTSKVVVSKFWHDELLRRFNAESIIIYNGIDTERYRFNLNDREPFILFVGGMEARKGLEFAIEVLEILQRRGLNLTLTAVARPGFRAVESRAWFDHLIERCGVAGKVKIYDLLPDNELAQLYSTASLFLSTSRMEGWGLSIMEAMASGCPVVAASVGGVRELIEDGDTGMLVEPGDLKGFADAIEKLLDDEALRKRMTRRAKDALSKYSWDAAARATVELYERVLTGRG